MFEVFSYYFTLAFSILVLCAILGTAVYSVLEWCGDTLWRRITDVHTLQGCSFLLGHLHEHGIKVTPEIASEVAMFLLAKKIKEEDENE